MAQTDATLLKDNTLEKTKFTPGLRIEVNSKIPGGTVSSFTTSFDSTLSDSFHLTEIGKEGLFVYDPTDTTSTQDGITVLVKGSKRYKYTGEINVKRFGAKGDGITDDTAAINAAITYLSSRTGNMNPVKYNNSLVFTWGTYLISNTLKIPANIRPTILGHVVIMATHAGVAVNICSETTTVPLYYKEMFMAGELIDCSRGQLNIFHRKFFNTNTDPELPDNTLGLNTGGSINRNKILAGTVGLKIGTIVDRRLVSRYDVSHVRIAGFETALEFIPFNNYMATYKWLHIEGNINCIKTSSPTGGGENSGENITFYKCRFSGADNFFLAQADAIDCTFNDCSIDFVKNVLYLDTMFRGFNYFKFANCYFESVTDYLVKSVSDASVYRTPVVDFDLCTLLNGRREMFTALNSGRGVTLNINRMNYRCDSGDNETDGREAWNSQDPDHFMLIAPGTAIGIRKKDVFQGLALPAIVENNVDKVYPYFNYKNLTVQSIPSTNPYLIYSDSTNIATVEVVTAERGNALKVTSATGLTGTFIAKAKQRIPVNFQDGFTFNAIYKLIPEVADLSISVRFFIEQFNIHNELISSTAPTVVNDTCEANVWRCTRYGHELRISDREVKYIRLCYQISGLGGSIYIDTIVIDKK